MDNSVEIKQMMDCIGDFVGDYAGVHNKWPKLRIIAAKYGKRFRKFGTNTLDEIKKDGRFGVRGPDINGGYVIEATGVIPLDRKLLRLFNEGESFLYPELLTKLAGSGLKKTDVDDSLIRLTERKFLIRTVNEKEIMVLTKPIVVSEYI